MLKGQFVGLGGYRSYMSEYMNYTEYIGGPENSIPTGRTPDGHDCSSSSQFQDNDGPHRGRWFIHTSLELNINLDNWSRLYAFVVLLPLFIP